MLYLAGILIYLCEMFDIWIGLVGRPLPGPHWTCSGRGAFFGPQRPRPFSIWVQSRDEINQFPFLLETKVPIASAGWTLAPSAVKPSPQPAPARQDSLMESRGSTGWTVQ